MEDRTDPDRRARLARWAARRATRKHISDFWYEEIHQEAWIAAWQAWDTWIDGAGSALTTWMLNKAYYAAMDSLRVILHARTVTGATIPVDLEAEVDQHPTYHEADFQHVENAVTLEQMMRCLTDKQRDLLMRVDLGSMTLLEYAQEEGVTEAAICYRRKRAIEKIRAWHGIDTRLPMEPLSRVMA